MPDFLFVRQLLGRTFNFVDVVKDRQLPGGVLIVRARNDRSKLRWIRVTSEDMTDHPNFSYAAAGIGGLPVVKQEKVD